MSAADLISRLDGVRHTGPGRWIARCPSHGDRNPSLSIREADDGKVLLHCFAQCPTEDILGSLGLELGALFPDGPLGDHLPRERRPFNSADILQCAYHEGLVVAVIGRGIIRGEAITPQDQERLVTAVARIGAAADLARGVA